MKKNFKVNVLNGIECEVTPTYSIAWGMPITMATANNGLTEFYICRVSSAYRMIIQAEYGAEYTIHRVDNGDAIFDETSDSYTLSPEELAILNYCDIDSEFFEVVATKICKKLDISYNDRIGEMLYECCFRCYEYESYEDLITTLVKKAIK